MGGVPWVTWKHAHVLATAPTLEACVLVTTPTLEKKKATARASNLQEGLVLPLAFKGSRSRLQGLR